MQAGIAGMTACGSLFAEVSVQSYDLTLAELSVKIGR